MQRGLPRPRFEGEQYMDPPIKNPPHPYTASDTDLATIDDGRQAECVVGLLCGVCGLPVPDGDMYIITEASPYKAGAKIAIDRLCLHGKCARMTMSMCPHMRPDKNKLRKTNTRWYRQKWSKL
jgi:hypothetical protein